MQQMFLARSTGYRLFPMDQAATPHAMDRPLSTPWWRRKRWVQLGVIAAVVVVGAVTVATLFGTADRSVRMPIANVTIATVEKGAFHDFVPLRATVVPLDTIYLDALEGGRVERILAQAGDTVTKGQPLVELSNAELELDVLDREGRLIESITQLQAYETQLEQNRISNQKALAQIRYDIVRLKRSLTRRNQLVARNLESVETRDTVQDELDHDTQLEPLQAQSNETQESLRTRQLPQIHSQLEKLQQDLQITHSKLDNLTVRAPVTGRLTEMELKVGENRNRGERFAQITPDTGFKLSAAVDEFYLQRVRNGQVALVEIADKKFELRVTRVYPEVKDGTFKVDLAFQGTQPEGLIPGQAVQGRLSLGADRMTTVLAAGAFLERTGGDWVFVLDRDGYTARRRTIKVGRRNAEQVEVEAHLAPGERVIVSDYTGLERIDRIDLEK
jgi:HlyD family secretion protein